jgi:hypothetical protein
LNAFSCLIFALTIFFALMISASAMLRESTLAHATSFADASLVGAFIAIKSAFVNASTDVISAPHENIQKAPDHITAGKQASHAEQVGQNIPNPIFHFAALISNTSARVIVAMRFALLLASFSLASAIACAASRHWIT